ncbi:uncharacterized protein LOC115726669 [Rhodamnia argentea]|uniref:Uncharacterized protein LOC115726669 n=1 Tax=Rhodamnia argentea TaxID=178133 RepID=A0A8B8MNQ8_9MYRT|nr:uncharacterized protein LOC115726669 [Rhodamnia argentea]
MTRQKTKNPSPTTTRHVVLRPAPVNRRDPLLTTARPPPPPSGARRARLAEVAGASSAECVAIWCCCPCAIADFFLLAVYRVPAGLCRRALRKRRRRRLTRQVAFTSKRGVRSGKKGTSVHDGDGEGNGGKGADVENAGPAVITLEELLEMRAAAAAAAEGVEEGAEMEVEMWRRFSNMGFWRSPSRGDEVEEEEECNAMQNLTLQKF